MTPFDYITDIALIAVVVLADSGPHTDPALAPATTGAGGRGGHRLPAPHISGW